MSRLVNDGIGTPPSSISHASPYLLSANKISIAKLESAQRLNMRPTIQPEASQPLDGGPKPIPINDIKATVINTLMRYKKDFISSEGSSSDRIKIVASVIGKISGIRSQHPPHDTMISSLKSSNLFATPGGTKKNC